MMSVAWTEGYCSGRCDQSECPGSVCRRLADGVSYCLAACTACLPNCNLGWDCGDALTCLPSGECGVVGTRAVGEPCSTGADCLTGVCIPETRQDAGLAWTGGSCSQECSSVECPADAVCVAFEDGSRYCAPGCAEAADCRDGYVCSTSVLACLPDCGLGWSCGGSLICDPNTGNCVDPTTSDAGVFSGDADTDAQSSGTDAGSHGPGPGGPWSLLTPWSGVASTGGLSGGSRATAAP